MAVSLWADTNQILSAGLATPLQFSETKAEVTDSARVGQGFDNDGAAEADTRSEQSKNQAHFQYRQTMPHEIQQKTAPKQTGNVVVKIEERTLHRLNQVQSLLDPVFEHRNASDETRSLRQHGRAFSHNQQGQKQKRD
jgi:hypothetical protein